ncbi:MAG: hypothetical protein KAH21_07985, partial [Spirochaetaceae bacterium]|nr:hypothetical protein [Spirochaetaceae bacterium]
MKRIITVTMVMVLIGSAAFARGTNENDSANGSRRGMEMESVELSGTVVEIDGQVVLETSDGTYALNAPGFNRAGVEIPYGETIEVRGSEAEGRIFVESAVVNGEELSFSNGRGNSDRGNSDRGNSDRGNSDRGNSDRGNSDQGKSGRGGR